MTTKKTAKKGKDITREKHPALTKELPPSFYMAPKRKKGEKPRKDEPEE